ncbi:hypothetical protein ABW19_dt0205806 [Dactylella cylindrospora]|nr:hypothetical protein ABW19_dt0205806 [Dactylella cylindrospora]
MSTSAKIHIVTPPKSNAVRAAYTDESTSRVNLLLQQNHDRFHTFSEFEDRLHNHVAHHLLALYALGGTADNLQFAYDTNVKLQLPIGDKKPPVIEDLSNIEDWDKYLGDASLYHTFMQFFQNAIDKIGWQEAIKRYLFSENAAKNGMPERLVSGFLHPWIHLGYGVEFEQPAIVAEALAQTAVHHAWTTTYLKACVESAPKHTGPRPTLTALFTEARSSEKLKSSTRWSDPQKNKAVYARALDEMVALASKWYIPPTASDSEIAVAAAQLVSAAAYICGSTPRLDKKVKFDFFYMHTVTSSIFLDVWVRQTWIGNAEKSVLLNYFGWMTVNMYVSRGCADVNLSQVETYIGKRSAGGNKRQWEDLIQRASEIKDDGHLPKTVRALMNGEEVTREYWGKDGFEITGDLWVKIAEMAVDSVEDCGVGEPKWVRSVGHDEAWETVGPRTEYTKDE